MRGIISDTDRWTMEAEAKSMLNQLGFSDYEEKMSHMSGGQKKRVALCERSFDTGRYFGTGRADEPFGQRDV